MTDAELRDAAWAELQLTTVGYVNKYWKTPPVGTHWEKAHKLLLQIGAVVPPPPPPPPPSTGNKYPPLQLTTPTHVQLSNANMRAAFNLDKTKDYVIEVVEKITAGTAVITGGRNMNLIFGKWDTNNAGASAYWDHGAIAIQEGAPGSTVHVEKVHIMGNTLNDGIVWACPTRHLQFQTVLIGPNQAYQDYHPDGMQDQGGCASLKIHNATIYTELQGIFLGDHGGVIGPVFIDRVNMIGAPGKILFWKSKPQASPITIGNDCYLHCPTPWTPSIGMWVYPNEKAEKVYSWSLTTEKAVVSDNGNYVSWSGCPLITGGFHKGLPPGGDYVTPAMIV